MGQDSKIAWTDSGVRAAVAVVTKPGAVLRVERKLRVRGVAVDMVREHAALAAVAQAALANPARALTYLATPRLVAGELAARTARRGNPALPGVVLRAPRRSFARALRNQRARLCGVRLPNAGRWQSSSEPARPALTHLRARFGRVRLAFHRRNERRSTFLPCLLQRLGA